MGSRFSRHMKKSAKPKDEFLVSVTRRLETLELETYMQAFSEFMEVREILPDPDEVEHLLGSITRRWKRLNDDDKFRTFGYALGVAKFLSLHTTADVRKAVRKFSALVYDTR